MCVRACTCAPPFIVKRSLYVLPLYRLYDYASLLYANRRMLRSHHLIRYRPFFPQIPSAISMTIALFLQSCKRNEIFRYFSMNGEKNCDGSFYLISTLFRIELYSRNICTLSRKSLLFTVLPSFTVGLKGLKLGRVPRDLWRRQNSPGSRQRGLIVRYFNPVTNNTVYFAIRGARFGEGP